MKIWFQNRRAKERKQVKKREEMLHKDKIDVVSSVGHPHAMHPHSALGINSNNNSMANHAHCAGQQIDTKPILGLE